MSRSNNRKPSYYLSTAKDTGASLFPSGLLMYDDLPSLRRTASRISNNIESNTQQSPSPIPSSSSVSSSSIVDNDDDNDDESHKDNFTTSEDWWHQAIEPISTNRLTGSHSTFSMTDDDSNDLFSILPSFDSKQKLIIHNQKMNSLTEIYSDKTIDCVKQWYEHNSVPNLNVLIKHNLLKIHKDKSIRMKTSNKKEIFAELDKNGKVMSRNDHRLFDSIEDFYQANQSHRKRNEHLSTIYQSVYWYDQTFHSILLQYAETIVKVSGMKCRLINDDELLSFDCSIEDLSKEYLCQINCWNEGRNEIDL